MLNKLLKSIWWLLLELGRVVVISVVEAVLLILLGLLLLTFIPLQTACVLQPGLPGLPGQLAHPVLQVLREYRASLGTTSALPYQCLY
jgi:hypothetical protein